MLAFLIFNVSWYLITAMLWSAETRIWMAVAWLGIAWLGIAILWFIGLHVVSRRAGGEHDENI